MSNEHKCRLVCVHRASGTLAGARALYETYVAPIKNNPLPWEEILQEEKDYWINMFRVAHKACKTAIESEPRG